jgi:4-amino-4-deoxy-L-arabinose transferase-like glycosyltransferase
MAVSKTRPRPHMAPGSHHRDLFWLLLCAFAVLAAGIGLREPWPADEPRFALVARTMVETGNYLFPHRGAELYPDKPPMFMWLQVLAYRLTGSWKIAFLLPSLAAALATLYLVHDIARRLWGPRAAAVAGWMLLFTVQFTYQSKRAQIDPVLVFLVTLSCYAFLRHFLLGPGWRWYALGFFAAGVGVITKGVGVIALLMLPAYFVARALGASRLAPIERGAARWWMGAPWLLLALALWLVPMLVAVATRGDPLLDDYARNILFGQTAQRYANPSHHFQPWWYFGEVIALTWLPLVLALPWALPAMMRRWRRRRDARFFVPALWVLLVLLFFSLSPGKRDMYILPALPMLCVALAPGLALALRRAGCRRLLFAFSALLAIALIGASVAALTGEPRFETKQEIARGLVTDSNAHWWMLLSTGAIAALALLAFRIRHAWTGLRAALSGIWIIAFGLWGPPLLDEANSARGVMREAGRIIGSEAELGLIAWREQNLLQADRRVAEFGFRRPHAVQLERGIAWLSEAPARRWLFVDAAALTACVDSTATVPVGVSNRRRWVLLQWPAIKPECRP